MLGDKFPPTTGVNLGIGQTVGVQFCKRCLMPNTRLRNVFDDEGVCNACHTAVEKLTIDWAARREEFLDDLERYCPNSGAYDCIVPWSGDKDSSSIAHKLKFEFGLNPLLVTFSPLLPNDVGAANCEAFIRLGFDHFLVRPDQMVSRHLSRRFFIERGNPKVHWDAGGAALPVQIAVKFEIPLIFYAEHGPSEYGGHVLSEEHRKIQDYTEVLENQIGDHPETWVDGVVRETNLSPYILPDIDKINEIGVTTLYFGYFFKWSAEIWPPHSTPRSRASPVSILWKGDPNQVITAMIVGLAAKRVRGPCQRLGRRQYFSFHRTVVQAGQANPSRPWLQCSLPLGDLVSRSFMSKPKLRTAA